MSDFFNIDPKKIKETKRIPGWIKVLLMLLIILIFFILWFFSTREQVAITENIKLPVKVQYPKKGELAQKFRINGYIESEVMVTILPKISGTLIDLKVDVGDGVIKDQVIGEVDSEPYRLTMKQAEAAYLAAKSTYDRISKLYKSKATSKQNYDNAKSQYEAYKSQYELAKLNFSYTQVQSPINGVVLQKHSNIGSLVAPQVPIVTLGDLKKLVIKAKIPDKYYHLFLDKKEDIGITIQVPALKNKYFNATIKTLSPYISPETKNFEIVCSIKGDISNLRPGMFIYMTFILDKKDDVFFLPFTSLVSDRYLWFVDKYNKAHKLDLIYTFSTDENFMIGNEYEDYKFIIEGQHFLKEGQEVKIINEEDL